MGTAPLSRSLHTPTSEFRARAYMGQDILNARVVTSSKVIALPIESQTRLDPSQRLCDVENRAQVYPRLSTDSRKDVK